MQYVPGRVEPGDGSNQKPIAIVTQSRGALAEYVAAAAALGPWVWVRDAADVRGLALGGSALLDQEPLPDDLRESLMASLLAG